MRGTLEPRTETLILCLSVYVWACAAVCVCSAVHPNHQTALFHPLRKVYIITQELSPRHPQHHSQFEFLNRVHMIRTARRRHGNWGAQFPSSSLSPSPSSLSAWPDVRPWGFCILECPPHPPPPNSEQGSGWALSIHSEGTESD